VHGCDREDADVHAWLLASETLRLSKQGTP